jgi:hypothetical protein
MHFKCGIVLLAAVVTGVAALSDDRDYALMIDAGSSGSRIRLFSWGERIYKTLPPPLSVPIQQEDFLFKVTPGIGEEAGRAELRKLVSEAKTDTQLSSDQSRWENIPIYLFATAGMRILDYDAREQAFIEVRRILSTSGFKFEADQAKGTRIEAKYNHHTAIIISIQLYLEKRRVFSAGLQQTPFWATCLKKLEAVALWAHLTWAVHQRRSHSYHSHRCWPTLTTCLWKRQCSKTSTHTPSCIWAWTAPMLG